MTTIPHQNPENGYAIRISKNLPKNAANLSYVHVDKPTPSKNINLKDYSKNIQENKATENNQVVETYLNNKGLLEVDQELFKTKNSNVLVTNEYAMNLDKTPLFYKYRTSYPLDVKNIQVSVILSGGQVSAPKYVHEYPEGQDSRFLYDGEKVHISRTENQPLQRDDIFKVTLEKEGSFYFIVVYSSKELLDDGYEIHYPSIQDGRVVNHQEIINLSTVFENETMARNYLSDNNFQVIENLDNTFSIKIDKEAGNFLITEDNREPYTFDYQLETKVKTRLGDKNPLEVNIGFIYLNETIFNATQTTAAMKKIAFDNPLMPNYLSFNNPHRRSEGVHQKTNSEYWEASISMPMEHWLDYDVLVISGHGEYDIQRMNQNIKSFLDIGGVLLVESAGTGSEVLELKNNQFTSLRYSKSQVEEGVRELPHRLVKDRYYDVNEIERIGRIQPVIEFMGQENESDWEIFVQHNNGGPSLIRKRTDEPGQILYSNIGLMQDILFNNIHAMKFFVNLIHVLLEERTFVTPVFSEFVYHKDDLYIEEYEDKLGRRLYFNDKSDEDRTQIVAKKIINNDIDQLVYRHLPEAYRNWESLLIKTTLFDEELVTIRNNQFSLSGEKSVFKETTTNAIPGFRYISYSGNQGTGTHVSVPTGNEPSHIQINTQNTQAFFEQEIGQLSPGYYSLQVNVATTNSVYGGFGIYDTRGEAIATQSVTGNHGWRNIQLQFHIEESQVVYLRLGAHGQVGTSNLKFSEVNLTSQGFVRMNKETAGGEPLYAYAINPKGKNNQLVAYEQTYTQPTILKENKKIDTVLRVRSFVYRWFTEEGRFRKEYGNEKENRVTINTKDREIILGNILEFVPPLYSGVQWSRKQNVFYEFILEDDTFVNLSIYDPSVDRFYFSPTGDWIISHEDIWWNGYDSTVQIKLHTDFYHLIATNNKIAIGYEPNKEFKVSLPKTEDERDRWHLQIQSGSFTKKTINASELEDLKELNKEHQYDEFLIGEHLYSLPEYNRQTFYPYFGQKLINEEQAVYVNPEKIEVQNGPLIITEISVREERLTPNRDRKVWSSQNIFWDSEELPQIYLDQNNTGQVILLTRGYRIDYREGKVIFDNPVEGTIYADYRHDNFKVYKRDFKNKNISNELLITRDAHTFQFSQKNITVMPAPKIYLGTVSDNSVVHPSRYWINYEEGTVHFFESVTGRLYGSYSYFTEEELKYRDVNKNTGEIYLEDRISFKDEIYVTYLAKENTLEYKGYYDEDLRQFIKLDLNPTSGHTFDYLTEDNLETLEGSELLDKEIYLYLLPYHSTYYKRKVVNHQTIRHVFHEEEWDRIKEVYPEALLLAQIQVRENTNKENIVMMDARKLGGGLKESVSEESVEKRLGYTNSFWDIGSFDGLAYYKNGVQVIQIPEKVLEVNGGHFNEDTIKEVVDKYIAYGIYPIIEFIGED